MNDLMEKFIKLPSSQKLAIVVVLYVAIVGAFWYFLYTPKAEELNQLTVASRKLKDERRKTQSIADNLEKFKQEVEALNEDLNRAVKELPNNREITQLLKRISRIGKKIGLEFLLFQPLPEVPEGFYAQVPVKIEVSGSYHEIAMFFDRIGKLSRIVNVNNIQMGSPTERGGKIILKTSGRITTYRFIDKAEQEKMNKGKKRRKKRKGH